MNTQSLALALPAAVIETLEARIAPAKFLPTLTPGSVGGSTGFEILVPDAEIQKITNIGDFNGDGRDDLAIVALTVSNHTGKVYVLYGNAGGFPNGINLANLNGTNGFSITGGAQGDAFGYSLDGGDLNGDGKADLAIGAPGFNDGAMGTDSGAVYVVFGSSATGATISLGSLTGTTGFWITGGAFANQAFGTSVVIGPSVNGDAFQDLVIGAPGHQIGSTDRPQGRAAVVFGKASGFANLSGISTLDGTTGFIIQGGFREQLGVVVNILDDLNGDGCAEINVGGSALRSLPLLVGDGEEDVGYIIFGKNTPWAASYLVTDFEAPDGIAIKDMRGAEIGSYFRTQDFNGDGIKDLLGFGGFIRGTKFYIGGFVAPREGNDMPSNSYFPEQWEVQGILDGISLRGSSSSGNVYIDGGDFNGDGFLDMIVDSDHPSLVFGRDFGGIHFIGKKDSGFAFQHLSGFRDNPRVQFIGDVNGDGFDDLAVQTSGPRSDVPDEGLKIVYGSDTTIARSGKSVTWTDVDGDQVTLKVSKGRLDYAMFRFAPPQPGASGGVVEEIFLPLSNRAYDVTITATPMGGSGDGLVKIGRIAAESYLDDVKIDGSLGEIDGLTIEGLLSADSLGLTPSGGIAGESKLINSIGAILLRGGLHSDLNVRLGVKNLKVGEIADGASINADRGIGVLQAVRVGDADINVATVGKLVVTGNAPLSVPGDFHATLTLHNNGTVSEKPVLGSAVIAGLVKDAVFDVSGIIGKFTAGAMEDSVVMAGYRATSTADPLAAGLFLMNAAVNKVTITGAAATATASGTSFANSSIIAAAIGRISIPSADDSNGGTAFGIGFRDSVGSIELKQPAFSYDKETGGTQSTGDFKVLKL